MNEKGGSPPVRQNCNPVPCEMRFENDPVQAVAMAKHYIDDNFFEAINLDELAELVGMTRFSLAKQFRKRLGVAPYHYVCLVRVQQAQAMIEQGQRPTEVASEVGFFDQSHLARHFKRLCGMTPRQYRARCLLKSE